MKATSIILTIIILVLLFGFVSWMWQNRQFLGDPQLFPYLSISPTASALDESISDGTITIKYSSEEDFALATNQQQVLATSYIPPCEPEFTYCFYYNGNTYEKTNFNGAGLRVKKRTDLTNETTCLSNPPEGFDSIAPSATDSHAAYATSKFSNVGQGAAGHITTESMYRLFHKQDDSCYEFRLRVGKSQFENYPAGTIEEFTADDEADITSSLLKILHNVELVSGEEHIFANINN